MSDKVVCTNRRANHEYFILDRYEAGLVLEGSEVKSLRLGNVNLNDAFCMMQGGEPYIKNMHIALYDKAGAFNTKDSRRDRKLLLHKAEILKINAKNTPMIKGLIIENNKPIKLIISSKYIKHKINPAI